jgi:pyrroloquinoline quinone biosynthesis protein D
VNDGVMHDSATSITVQARPCVGRGFRLQWEPAQNSHVLLYPEGMVKLNGSAGEIVSRCDGKRTLGEIVADLENAFDATGLSAEVTDFVTFAVGQKWLEIRS